jgi:antitoxin (DNA-binding transcriptional repressor) of toxin-antitoxin stability system
VLHHHRRVARLVPVRERRRWIPATEVVRQLAELGPDPTGLMSELRDTLTDTTEDLRW